MLPVKDRSKVRHYTHFDELFDCLASGWSAPAIHEYLSRRFGTRGLPGISGINDWRKKNMPEVKVLTNDYIRMKLGDLDYKVDIVKHLSRLVPLMEDRMARGLSQEENTFCGLPLQANDGVTRVYMEAVMNLYKVMQDLGIMPRAAPTTVIDARQQNVFIPTPETLNALVETAKMIKALGLTELAPLVEGKSVAKDE